MRDSSPTGGALGNVTEKELALLQAVRGSLKQAQTPEQILYNLMRLNNVILDIVHGPGNGGPRYDLSKFGVPDAGTASRPKVYQYDPDSDSLMEVE